MTKSAKNPQVDRYLTEATKWPKEIAKLRSVFLECGLTEEFKWAKPCYSFQGGNVVIILPLKEHCALLFAKGALLKDPHGLLIKAGENTQAARQVRFTSLRAIAESEAILKGYVHQAIEIEKAGLDVVYKKISDFKAPVELQKQLDASAAFQAAFSALTPGRQRGYFIYISGAKQTKTREARVEKCRPRILQGKGLQDR